MDELDRYLFEINRIQKNVNLYHDLFCVSESRAVLDKFNSSVFSVFQRSLNTEIILSVSKAFDTDSYKHQNEEHEYLSQRNLAKKYSKHINNDVKILKEKTTKILAQLNIKGYRDFVLAHNNKAALLGDVEVQKHLIETDILLSLLNTSYDFIFALRLAVYNIEPKYTVTRPKKYANRTSSEHFIEQLKNI